MSGYVVMVDFRLLPGSHAAFRKLIDENAKLSCSLESGCRRFDVIEGTPHHDRVVLYEIYDDRAAFDLHVASEHFKRFDAASRPHVVEKIVSVFALVCEGSAIEVSGA